MITTILTHQVKDFRKWKKIFDADASLRREVGIKVIGLYTTLDHPDYVTIISEFPSLEIFQEFMFGREMKAKMKKAGVVGEFETRILNRI